MESKESVIERLKSTGYETIFEYDDKPGEFFPLHAHSGEEFLVVICGTIEVDMDGKHYSCGAGDELLIPQEMPHEAKIGSEGCVYIVGEKEKSS